jgi:hypothetical protein
MLQPGIVHSPDRRRTNDWQFDYRLQPVVRLDELRTIRPAVSNWGATAIGLMLTWGG